MNKKLILSLCAASMLASCSKEADVTVDISDEVINANYIGNGVEWDPYDEADSWGAPLTDEDWTKVFSRLDYMRPAYVRCMINSPYRYFDAATGTYSPSRNFESMGRLLDYCQKNDIMVIYGEYNPPTWDMKQDQKWIDMAVDYLNMLVMDKGFTCIKHFVIFNEPDGDWASTNGDFGMWLSMLKRFHAKMQEYPGLLDKVSLAGPDAVADYKNRNSEYDTAGWIAKTAEYADSIVGLYDIHSYPGQAQVRDGSYGPLLKGYKELVPEGKQIVLGEAGYKYWREADSVLMAEYNRRVEGHPFTKGSDCNMLVYDNFYGVDMPLLISEVMNSGFSGVAAWMLDDAMHSQGDSGTPQDIKIWGMWNTLGEKVFNDKSQEDVRPWYYTWSLMTRYFPKGCNVLKSVVSESGNKVYSVAARNTDNQLSIAIINVDDNPHSLAIQAPRALENAKAYIYRESDGISKDDDGLPVPEQTNLSSPEINIDLPGNSVIVITEMN